MKKYLSFFRMRFLMGLQYRAAAAAGVVTQFTWGFMELLVFRAFYQADASAFPMPLTHGSRHFLQTTWNKYGQGGTSHRQYFHPR